MLKPIKSPLVFELWNTSKSLISALVTFYKKTEVSNSFTLLKRKLSDWKRAAGLNIRYIWYGIFWAKYFFGIIFAILIHSYKYLHKTLFAWPVAKHLRTFKLFWSYSHHWLESRIPCKNLNWLTGTLFRHFLVFYGFQNCSSI